MIYQIEIAEQSEEFIPFFCSSKLEEANASLENLLSARIGKPNANKLSVFQILKAECERYDADEISFTMGYENSDLKIKMAYRQDDELDLTGGCHD
ncbi:hypothetical protein [Weissella minor]|uniref:hypothetical protein n=1 Tax=Weissella minor TaxID=1620 RepID=UPI003AF24D25